MALVMILDKKFIDSVKTQFINKIVTFIICLVGKRYNLKYLNEKKYLSEPLTFHRISSLSSKTSSTS